MIEQDALARLTSAVDGAPGRVGRCVREASVAAMLVLSGNIKEGNHE